MHYIFDFDANSFDAKFSTDVLNAYPMAKEPNFWQNIRFGEAINMRTVFSERRVQMLEEKIAQLKLELETQKNPVEIARINNSIKLQTRKLKNLKDIEKPLIAIVENKEYKSTLMMDYGIRSSNFIMNLLESQWMHYKDAKEGIKQEQSNDSGDQQEFRDSVARQIEVEEFYNGLDIEEKAMLCMFANDARQIRSSLYRHKVEYLSAHTATQKVLFSIEDKNDYIPFVQYTLGVVVAAYREFSSRVKLIATSNMSKPERIREIIKETLGKITKTEIMQKCPDISQVTVQRALNDLVTSGEILKIGGGRYTAYTWNHNKEN